MAAPAAEGEQLLYRRASDGNDRLIAEIVRDCLRWRGQSPAPAWTGVKKKAGVGSLSPAFWISSHGELFGAQLLEAFEIVGATLGRDAPRHADPEDDGEMEDRDDGHFDDLAA